MSNKYDRISRISRITRIVGAACKAVFATAVLALPARAQEHAHKAGMVHTAGMTPPTATVLPTQGGQAAFAAISEIIKLLEADPTTDWSRVNLERLRLHLIDMDLVTLRSRVTSTTVPGGVLIVVRGTGATIGAIQRMTRAHANMVAKDTGSRFSRTQLPDGARLTATAANPSDEHAVARLRGLGFIGLMAAGDHHAAHHIMLARGDAMVDHGH